MSSEKIQQILEQPTISNENLIILENELRKNPINFGLSKLLIKKIFIRPEIYSFAPCNLGKKEKFFVTEKLIETYDNHDLSEFLDNSGLKNHVQYANVIRKYLISIKIEPLISEITIVYEPRGISKIIIDTVVYEDKMIFTRTEVEKIIATIEVNRLKITNIYVKPTLIEMEYYPLEYKINFFNRENDPKIHAGYIYHEKPNMPEYIETKQMDITKVQKNIDEFYSYFLPNLYFMTTIKIENTNKKPEQVERSLKNKLESINKIQEKIKSIANNPDPYIQFIEITKMASDHFYILFRRLLENQDDYNLPFYEKTIRHRSVY